jgi:hypothetical protein
LERGVVRKFEVLKDKKASDQDLFWSSIGFMNGVLSRAASSFASRRLRVVFKKLAEEDDDGFLRLLKVVMLIHSKPEGWGGVASRIINRTDRSSFYILQILDQIMKHLKNDVNTLCDQNELKRLVAAIQAKRALRKNTVGSKALKKVLGRLEEGGFFEEEPS